MEIKDYIKTSELKEIKRELLETLNSAVSDPERMKKFARFVLSTHTYSLFNKMIMHYQYPEVSQVMGKIAWEKTFQRTLKSDINPISILAPVFKSEKDDKGKPSKDKSKKILIGFRTVKVYDITQTEGPDIEIVTEHGLKVDNPEELLEELVFITALDGYTVDLQAMGFKEGSRVSDKSIHINQALDMESKIVELINVLSKMHLQHYDKRKELSTEAMALEAKMVTTIISSVVGTAVNANVNIDLLEDKSITAIFKAADSVAKAMGVKLRNKEVA